MSEVRFSSKPDQNYDLLLPLKWQDMTFLYFICAPYLTLFVSLQSHVRITPTVPTGACPESCA